MSNKKQETYFKMSLEHLISLTKVPLLSSKDIAIIWQEFWRKLYFNKILLSCGSFWQKENIFLCYRCNLFFCKSIEFWEIFDIHESKFGKIRLKVPNCPKTLNPSHGKKKIPINLGGQFAPLGPMLLQFYFIFLMTFAL